MTHNYQLSLDPILDRFINIISHAMRKEEVTSKWNKFRTIMNEKPLDYNKIYTELRNIQNETSLIKQTKQIQRKEINANIRSITSSKNKSNSLHKKQSFSKDQLKSTEFTTYKNEQTSVKSERENFKFQSDQKGLGSWKTNMVNMLSTHKKHRQYQSAESFIIVKFCQYLKNPTFVNMKSDSQRQLFNLSFMRSGTINYHFQVLVIGFFSLLIKEISLEEIEQDKKPSLFNIYNKVSESKSKILKNQQMAQVFLKVFCKILKKYTQSKKRLKYFFQNAFSDRIFLESLIIIFKDIIAERQDNKNKKNQITMKYINIAESYRLFTLFFNLKVYNYMNNQIKYQYYEKEDSTTLNLTIFKQETNFYIILDEIQNQHNNPGQIYHHPKTQKKMNYYPESIPQESKHPDQIDSLISQKYMYSPSLKNAPIKSNLQSNFKSISKMNIIDYTPKVNKPSLSKNKTQTNLINKTKQLLQSLNLNTQKINSLVKFSVIDKEKEVKNPLISLQEVYPLNRDEKHSPRRLMN